MELAREFDFAVALELNEGVFVNRLTPTVEQIAGIVEHPVPPVVDIEEMFERKECCQLCFYFDEETEQKVMPLLPGLSATRWHPLFADVNVAGTSKATGLSLFADYYRVKVSEIMRAVMAVMISHAEGRRNRSGDGKCVRKSSVSCRLCH